jgi:3-methylfumaryl-CoA hydratase
MLDRDDPLPKLGDALPIGSRDTFSRVVRQSQIGPDGHRGAAISAPVPLPRRMFAGKRIRFHAELRVGDEVTRDSTIRM